MIRLSRFAMRFGGGLQYSVELVQAWVGNRASLDMNRSSIHDLILNTAILDDSES